MVKTDTKKVIILGAGITGLVTAWKLANAGLSVLIIEKEDTPGRVGKNNKERRGIVRSGSP